jgi:cell division protein DivIC
MIFLGFIISDVKWKKIRLKLIINNDIIGNTRSDIVSKKITKKDKRRISLIFGFMILVMAIIIFNISKIWLKILEKNKEYHFLENELVRLNKEEKNLKNELVKLQNPDYVARYAREKYLYSRDGEITIKIP